MSPRTKKQFQDIRQASIQKILDAAMKLFSTKGYVSVSVKDIAKAAGISQGLMYNYFESKEKLLSFIVSQMIADMGKLMTGVATAEAPVDQLKNLIKSSFQMLREQRAFYEMLLPIVTQQAVALKVRKQLQMIFQSATSQLEEIFSLLKITNPREEAFKLGAILDGIGWHYLFIFSDYPLAEMEQKLLADYGSLLTPNAK